jgi:hypothetical protein
MKKEMMLALNNKHYKYVFITFTFFACGISQEAETQNASGYYELIIDLDHTFSQMDCPVRDDKHSVIELEFMKNGIYNVYYVFNETRSQELYDDLTDNNHWVMKDDTLVIKGSPDISLLFIKELNCFATNDLSLVIKKKQ